MLGLRIKMHLQLQSAALFPGKNAPLIREESRQSRVIILFKRLCAFLGFKGFHFAYFLFTQLNPNKVFKLIHYFSEALRSSGAACLE